MVVYLGRVILSLSNERYKEDDGIKSCLWVIETIKNP